MPAAGSRRLSRSSTSRRSPSTFSAAGRRSRRPARCSAGRHESTSSRGSPLRSAGCASVSWPAPRERPIGSRPVTDRRSALITGVTGQDGSYLADLLLEKGYEVHGMVRRTSTSDLSRIRHIQDRIKLVPGDLMDQHSLTTAVHEIQPDEVYNLAAQSFDAASWSQPVLTGELTGMGVTRMLEAARLAKPDARFYQASSSEMLGKVKQSPENENTPF